MRKLRSSTKIFIGFALITAVSILGYRKITDAMIMGEKFGPIAPGKVNIVGINPGAGYRVIVANEIAQLVETQGGFGGSESGEGGATEGSIKRRIPIKELLGTLQGHGEDLGKFVMWMNNLQENETWPPHRVLWSKADIQKALAGDPAVKNRLEANLNVKLDGTPLSRLNFHSLEDGIFVVTPVSLTVNINGKPTVVTGEIMQPYKPRLITTVESRYADKANVDNTMRAGYYAEEAKKMIDEPGKREDVRKTLEDMISDTTARARTETPERILKSATVVVNETYIVDAGYDTYDGPNGKKLHNLTVDLNDEGRRRLWQFSKYRVGDQLLLVSDGVAIAAPTIQHELAQGELTISKMPDETLLRDAVDTIKSARGRTAQR